VEISILFSKSLQSGSKVEFYYENIVDKLIEKYGHCCTKYGYWDIVTG
jgi:hypothetical protein